MRKGRSTLFAVVLLLGLAGGLRFFELGTPDFKIYDEFFYARDACTYVVEGQFFCGDVEDSWAHPPVAKWLIAAGIWAFAPTPIGARVAVAAIGTLAVLVLFFLGRRISGSTTVGFASASLLAIDPLHLVNSRAAMLDTFAGFFVLVALLGYVYDRDDQRLPPAPLDEDRSRSILKTDVDLGSFRSRWLLVCGLACGLAIGSKWTVGPILPILMGVVVWDARTNARRRNEARPLRHALKGQGKRIALYLVLVPVVTYSFSYIGRIDGRFGVAPWDERAWMRRVAERQIEMAQYHLELRDQYDEVFFQSSPAWSWPLTKRGFPYGFMIRDGRYYEVLATGNPLVWWTGLVAIAALVVMNLRRRSEDLLLKVILMGLGGTYLYWLVAGIGATQVYLNYFVPAVPFLCLAVAAAWAMLMRTKWGRVAVPLHAASTAALFVFLAPVLLFRPLSPEAWERRMLFSQCRPHPVGKKVVVAGFRFESQDLTVPHVRSFEEGEEPAPDSMVPMLSEAEPGGWCWR